MLVLQLLKKNVISYWIGRKPSIYAGSSHYTFPNKVYRRYVFAPFDTRSISVGHIYNTLNTEV
jgi:hypothetical protein